MGFLNGTMTFQRYRITKDPTGVFGDDHLKTMEKSRIGAFKTNLHEKPNVGFTAGDHLFDVDFDFAKNIIGEALHFGVRVDSCQIPGAIKRAWMQMELAPMMVENPGGRPSKAQREEAKAAVEQRCADEADKGNFKRMAETPMLWDAETESMFVGSISEKVIDICLGHLENAFAIEVAPVSSGKLAIQYAEENGLVDFLEGVQATSFHPDGHNQVVWWNGMSENFDYLGNEFLLWLWWHWEMNTDIVELPDGSAVSGMFSKSLVLDCPRGEFGKETVSSDSPVALPETTLAVRMGKLPRKAGLTLVREGEQYEFALQAESFAINGARISRVTKEDNSPRDDETRIGSIRRMMETLDMLYGVFCSKRLSKEWDAETKAILKWLRSETRLRVRKSSAA